MVWRKTGGEKMKNRFLAIMLAVALLVVFGAGTASAAPKFSLAYFDGHMHTWRSDGSGGVPDIKATALSRGLSAVIITDHCRSLTLGEWESLVATCEIYSDSAFLALPGVEVTGSDGMLNRDHINALVIDDPFVGDDFHQYCPEELWESPPSPLGAGPLYPQHLANWVEYIHDNGGITVHNHPSGSTKLQYGVKNLEIYNQSHVDDVMSYAMMLEYPPQEAWELGMLLNNLAIYGEVDELNMLMPNPGFPGPAEIPMRDILWWATLVFSGTGQWLGAPQAPLTSWDELLMAYVEGTVEEPTFGLANSDAHNTGDFDSNVGVAKNGAYIKDLTAKELAKAIRGGRTFGTTGPSLALDVNGEFMGGTAYVLDSTAAISLSVNSESATAILAQIDIIKNGEVWHSMGPLPPTYDGTLVDTAVIEDGYYRVEVTAYDTVSETYSFAWSNPVFVDIP
jgi:hypothetical protein